MIYILIPVYNEELNLPNLKREIDTISLNDDFMLIFSDDGSKDNSIAIISELFANYKYQILGDGNNYGPGHAFNVGFEWILENTVSDKDIIVTMEADCTSDINLLPKMVAISQMGFDLVLASVYAQGGGFDKTTFFRRVLSSLANLMFRFLFNIKVLTLSSFYRVYSIQLLKKIQVNYGTIIKQSGFISMLEVLHKAIKLNAKLIEVPMTLNSKLRVGKSKMKVLKTSLSYFSYFIKRK